VTINDGCRFIYGNQISDEYGVMLCSLASINTDSNEETTTIITSKTSLQRKTDLHAVQYTDSLRFKLTIAKTNGEYINVLEERHIKKWLCKGERRWLSIDQDDLAEIQYFCTITNPQKDNVAKKTGGITFDVECDWGGAWTSLIEKTYNCNNTHSFLFNLDTDFEKDILYPVIKITPTTNGNISIINNSTQKIMSVSNCIVSEIITFDNDNNIFQSTSGRVLLDSWNKEFLELIDGFNNITLNGNFKLDLAYRLPVRVGG
jgi:hypothetical protein